MRAFPLKALVVLAAIWVVAGGIVWLARSARATPESVVKYVEAHPVAGKSPAERDAVLHKLADQLNALEYDQRREVRMSHKLDLIFRNLTPEEQGKFIDLTMPAGFKQMMEAFNKMEPAKRKAIVDRALEDMRKRGESEQPPPPDDPNMRKIVDAGLHSFYSDASAETKLDLAPVIEQMQRNLQGLH